MVQGSTRKQIIFLKIYDRQYTCIEYAQFECADT